jgi:hypothetical protein
VTELRALGVPEHEIEPVARFQQDRAAPAIWPDNAKSFRLFLAVQTQWRFLAGGKMPIATGLDYPGIEAAARMSGVKMTPRRFDDIRVMEAEARCLMNDRHG